MTTSLTSAPTTGRVRQLRPVPAATAGNNGSTPRVLMIVLPEGGSVSLDPDGDVALGGGEYATPSSHLWVARTWWWQHRDLLRYRKIRNMVPGLCAGGQRHRINFTAMQAAAAYQAASVWQTWAKVVHGTDRAKTPAEIDAQLRGKPGNAKAADPDEVRRRFDAQPRIIAMRMHNAANPTATQLDPHDIEILQAGQGVYQNYSAARAVCGDAVQTATGARIEAAGPSLQQRMEFLHQATRLLTGLPARQRIVAVTH